MSMGFRKDFLWGGATAANQYEGGCFEGGRGLATSDIITNGSHTVPRRTTVKNPDGTVFVKFEGKRYCFKLNQLNQ